MISVLVQYLHLERPPYDSYLVSHEGWSLARGVSQEGALKGGHMEGAFVGVYISQPYFGVGGGGGGGGWTIEIRSPFLPKILIFLIKFQLALT